MESNENSFDNVRPLKLMKFRFLRKHWKSILILLIVIFGFIFYYEILPKYNNVVANFGYDKCLDDLEREKGVPLIINQEGENETISQRAIVGVCSEFFANQYNAGNICGVGE